jgi:cell wall-associated NlpC family hydrolase
VQSRLVPAVSLALAAGLLSPLAAQEGLTLRLVVPPKRVEPPPPAPAPPAGQARAVAPPAGQARPAVPPARQLGVRRRTVDPLPPATGVPAPGTPPLTTPGGPPPGAETLAVTGWLGRLAGPSDVYRLPDARSPWLARLRQGTDVVIVSQWEGWYAIVMTDRTQGYVPQTLVEVLPYHVKTIVAPPPAATAAPAARRSETGTPWTLSSRGMVATAGWQAAAQVARGFTGALLQEASRYQGVPYVWGGNTERGLDCSGFVKRVFGNLGIPLPRRASEQARVGVEVPLEALQPGDRIYFSVRRTHDHTGIYLANGYFIHAGRSRGDVGVDHLSMPFYRRTFAGGRR